jgi:hypothetical protein
MSCAKNCAGANSPEPLNVFTAETHDCMEKVRPDTGREAGLGRAGDRAMQGAIAERTQRKHLKDKMKNYQNRQREITLT